MKGIKARFLILSMVLIILSSGCGGGGQTYTLECNIDTEQYGFSISGEEGPVTIQTHGESTSTEYQDGNMSSIKVEVNRTLTFENSGNSYDLEGEINVDFLNGIVKYDITATGDTFEEPQSCKQ